MDNASNKLPTLAQEHAIQAIAWFSVLMHARKKCNSTDVTAALHELQKLGVVVEFSEIHGRGEGADND